MSLSETLCEHCMTIPRHPEHVIESAQSSFPVGTWLRVRESQCPLCRLIQFLAYESYRTSATARIDDSASLCLSWWSTSGPGKRGAFCLSQDGVQHGDYWICFAAKLGWSPGTRANNYLLPTVHPELDIAMVGRWLSTCQARHSGRCTWEKNITFSEAFPGLQVMRFIDVDEKRLVEVREMTQYVALSYIWGNVDNLRLTLENKSQLLLPGSIERNFDRLPATIKDSIILVRKLKLRYLWVNALCLIQNDSHDLERGVKSMDFVYERAWLTIIAACGHDANAGLPGVYPASRKTCRLTLEVAPGSSLGVYTTLDQLLKGTVYNSRAWKFQEHVLSRRALYFVDNRIFFRCANAEFTESCLDHSKFGPTADSLASILPVAVHMADPLGDFAIMLLYYSQKQLTNQKDALRAMTGIMRRISAKAKTPFLEGLPAVALDAFILFKKNSPRALRRRKGFPSYSWSGWRGSLVVDVPVPDSEMYEWLMNETWIVWYKRNPSGITNLVLDPAASDTDPKFGKLKMKTTGNGYFKSEARLNISVARTAITEDPFFTSPVPSYPLLQFWTMLVYYKLSNIDVFEGRCRLTADNGTDCGELYLDGFEELTFFTMDKPLEIILLSGLSPINVMLIERIGGIAERRGVGTLHPEALLKSFKPGPRWTEIYLG